MGYAKSPAAVGAPYWVSVQHLASHWSDFHIFTALCSKKSAPPKRSDWVIILNILKKSEKRLINWCPSISFPINGGFPKSCQTYHSMVNMFFNPDLGRRLRLIPIEGRSQHLFDSCYGTDITHSRAYFKYHAIDNEPCRGRRRLLWMHISSDGNSS